jgi:hypothetical protein
MRQVRANQAYNQEYKEYLASGSSRKQLNQVVEAIRKADLTEDERQYVDLEVVPMLMTLFSASVQSRGRYMDWSKWVKYLGLAISVMSMTSATQAVPSDIKWIPLLVAGILGVVRELIQDTLRARQPVLDWVSARESFDAVLGEVVHWLSRSDIYSMIPEQNDRFLEFARRVSLANGNNERKIQQQIQTLLETRIEESEKPGTIERSGDLSTN